MISSNVLLLLFLNMFILFDIFLDKLRFITLFVIILFVVASQQALSWSFRKVFLKSLCRSFCFLSVMPLDNITWYARVGVFQLTRFKSAPSHDLESTLNTPIFTSIWVLFLTFCNFIINLGLSLWYIVTTNLLLWYKAFFGLLPQT